MALDMKDWITNRFEELASERYPDADVDSGALPDNVHQELWERAEADYISMSVAKAESAVNLLKERKCNLN